MPFGAAIRYGFASPVSNDCAKFSLEMRWEPDHKIWSSQQLRHGPSTSMSALSNISLQLFEQGRMTEAEEVARRAVEEARDDYHTHYALGLCLRAREDFEGASASYETANRLAPGITWLLLALAIARQMKADYAGSIDALKECLAVDPDYVLGFNTLGMTQKLMGQYEKASHNYDAGAFALARHILVSLENSPESARLQHGYSRNHLWFNYAVRAALARTALDNTIDSVAFPSSELAERDAATHEYRGLYWIDTLDANGKRVRLFLPNFFNTFFNRLRNEAVYSTLIGNRSTVLGLLGETDEANAHFEEAEDFRQKQA